MDGRHMLRKEAVLLFMVFIAVLSGPKTFAYWTNGILDNSGSSTGSVGIGDWSQAFLWSADITYQTGDRVIYNGITYEARKTNTNINPSSTPGKNYWRVI